MSQDLIDILLTTEGTYPTGRGGVSTWCDQLVRGVQGVRYHIYAVLAHPFLDSRFTLPASTKLTRVPMWGTEEPTEHLDLPFSQIYERKLRTSDAIVRMEFLPLFDQLLTFLLNPNPDGERFGRLLQQMHQWFEQYDYMAAMKSLAVWDFYLAGLRSNRWTQLSQMPTIYEAIQGLGWLYRFLVVLNTPVPRSDITHVSAAAFAGIPGIVAKLERGTPFLLSEHGIYLREQYLSIGRTNMSLFGKRFLMSLVRNVSAANYAHADLVAPVAAFNANWERRLGVHEDRIRVIYNGVDPALFTPRARTVGTPLTVVSIARIDPIKDIVSLLHAAAKVREQMPEVRFAVYGGVSVPEYYKRCLALREELGLTDSFVFAGHVDDVPGAYASGDVVVLPSISEGFPYAVVEAMMCGRPVIATDVGGNREALGDAGMLVEPQNPQQLATTIMSLLKDPALRASLAEEGRERALAYFTIQRQLELYRATYAELARTEAQEQKILVAPIDLVARRRELALDRARALRTVGRNKDAIRELRVAADLEPRGAATPGVLLQIAECYMAQGELERAAQELSRAELLANVLQQARRAG